MANIPWLLFDWGKRKYTDSTGHTSFFHNKETSSEDSLDKSRQSKPSTNSSLMVPSLVPIVGSSTLATSVAPASILHSPLGQLSSPPSLGYTQISQAYGASYPQTPVSISIIESLNKNGQVTKLVSYTHLDVYKRQSLSLSMVIDYV